ncbi:MAG: glutamine--fructose-6-phosphate transaminase (isomerizing), partial [Candidatus Saccharibacteria bacterium]|nr:glutamine--fructose-6-phosphate transaminase (isomerizing) [Candidatus Saccharibacteria bacterium]
MGSVGTRPAKNIVYTGLKRQEYRGYDSAGIAVMDATVRSTKAVGDTSSLDMGSLPDDPTVGIGHTRWATHGKPTIANAHPHTFGNVTLVHNGIIENFEELKKLITASKLKSQTDSEVLAGVIDHFYTGKTSLQEALNKALLLVKGTFGLLVISPKAPNQIIAARRGSPVVIGIDDDQYYIASDPNAIVDYTDKVIYLEDDQVAIITSESINIYDLQFNDQHVSVTKLDGIEQQALLGDYDSYLEKEIFEQPMALQNVMRGRVSSDGSIVLGGPSISMVEMEAINRIVIIGCGSAYYAGFYAKYKLEEMLGISVNVEHASEFRYRYGAYTPEKTLAIFMSQSGETADTLASLKEAKRRKIKTMGVVNSVGSTLAREVDHGGIYLHAGVETSVASTKAFTSMVTALLMLGGFMANKLGMNATIMRDLAHELLGLEAEISATLELKPQIDALAKKLAHFHDWFFL